MSQQNKNITFAYWVPNVSGGLVVSNIEQRTDWSYDYNVRLAPVSYTHLTLPTTPYV